MAKQQTSSPQMRQTYDRPLNHDVTDNSNDPAVKDFLRLITDNYTQKNQKDTKNQTIIDLFEGGFEIKEPRGPKKINSKKVIQAIWRVASLLKPHGFTMHGAQAQPWEEKLMTAGTQTILRKGGCYSSFRDKGGVAMNLLMFGDGFRLIGAKMESGFPIEFIPLANSNFYCDTRATSMRGGSKPVTKAAAIFSGTWNQFCSYFPKMAKKAGAGRLPRETSHYKETDQSYLQRVKQDEQITEWGYYYDIENRVYNLCVGSKCTIIEQKIGNKYPYVYKDEEGREIPYIPISQYSCIPSVQGFYNHGIPELIYDLVLLYAGIFNQMAQSIEDHVSPLEFVNLPQGEEAKFFEKLEMAYQERALGRRALVPITQSAAGGNNVGLQAFTTSTLINEAEALFNRIDLELKRLGIYLDEPETAGASNTTATEILSNIENSNRFSRQIMEFNGSEAEFELNVAIDMAKKFIKSSDKTPLNITTMLNIDGKSVRPDFATLGLYKKALKEKHWFFSVNTRVKESEVMRRAELSGTLPLHSPGSQTFNQIVRELTELGNVDYVEEAAMPPPSTPQGQASPDASMVSQSPDEVARDEIRFRELSPV